MLNTESTLGPVGAIPHDNFHCEQSSGERHELPGHLKLLSPTVRKLGSSGSLTGRETSDLFGDK